VITDEARQRFATSPVARLATVDTRGRPHLVPLVFVVRADTIYSGVDAKPKRSTALRRLANIAANPRVALLVDHYEDDWDRLWWVRADGTGRVLDPAEPEGRSALGLLAARFPRYESRGAILAVDVDHWSGWSASPDA
jgi:PPOX class probable F420-dependent enzyme